MSMLKCCCNSQLQEQLVRLLVFLFGLAEEMLAENEKRKDKSRPDVIEKMDNADWVNEIEKRGLAE